MRDHKARVQAGVEGQECWKATDDGVDEAFQPPLTDITELCDANSQVVCSFCGIFTMKIATRKHEPSPRLVKSITGSLEDVLEVAKRAQTLAVALGL